MKKRAKSIIGLACATAFTLSMATTSRAANDLIDPGAEAQTVSGTGNGVGGWTLGGGAVFSQDVAHSGTWSIKEFGPGAFAVPYAFQTFPTNSFQVVNPHYIMTGFGLTPAAITPAVTSYGVLEITFFSGPNGTGVNLGTAETPGNGQFSAVHIDSTTPLNTWVSMTVTAHAPVSAQSVGFYALVLDQTPTHVYFDDLTAAQVIPEPSSYALVLTGLGGLVMLARKRRA